MNNYKINLDNEEEQQADLQKYTMRSQIDSQYDQDLHKTPRGSIHTNSNAFNNDDEYSNNLR